MSVRPASRIIRVMSLLLGVDAVVLRVPDLDAGLAFYCDGLGHELLWRTESMAGLRMAASGTELVLALDRDPETDMLVESVENAVRAFVDRGGSLVSGPQDIPVGKVAVVRDPFGNELVLVDLSKGRYAVDDQGRVMGIAPTRPG
jgi:catechol 2,3-dioxygenase-like lactoylglutathione lyase family enzyme